MGRSGKGDRARKQAGRAPPAVYALSRAQTEQEKPIRVLDEFDKVAGGFVDLLTG